MTPLIAHTPASPHRLVACYHRPMLTDGDDSLRIGRGGGGGEEGEGCFLIFAC